MRNRVEVAFEVAVHAPDVALPQQLLHPPHRFPTPTSRPKPVAAARQSPSRRSVPERCRSAASTVRSRTAGNPQRALLGRARLRYPDPPRRLAAVASRRAVLRPAGPVRPPLVRRTARTVWPSTPALPSFRHTAQKAACRLRWAHTLVPESEPDRLSARFARAASACGRSRPNVPPTPSGRGLSPACLGWLPQPLSPVGLAFVIRHGRSASTFLRPLAPRALPRFLATTDALTPAGRLFGPCGHEHRSVPGGSPCLSRPHFRPFCPQPPRRPSPGISVRSRFGSARDRQPADPVALRRQRECLPTGSWPGLRTALAGSPVGVAESGSRCVMFIRIVTDGLFTSGSSPPRVATTQ